MSGKHLATSFDLLAQIRSFDYSPPGILIVVDTTKVGNDPDLYSLGNTHLLMYVEAV